jgi:hypothetical protein
MVVIETRVTDIVTVLLGNIFTKVMYQIPITVINHRTGYLYIPKSYKVMRI